MCSDFVGESSQDEEEEVKPVTVKFAQQESEEAKARRMASFDYLQKKQQEEAWQKLQYHNITVWSIFLFWKKSSEVAFEIQKKPNQFDRKDLAAWKLWALSRSIFKDKQWQLIIHG